MQLSSLIRVRTVSKWLASIATPLGLALFATLLLAAVPAQAAMYGYISNPGGIYRLNSQTAAQVAVYTGAPFDGATVVAGLAMRPSDGMLFFVFNNTANQALYRWDPATPTTAAVLVGTTGKAVPYIHRLGFHPTNGNLYGNDLSPATTLWTLNQTTGAATAAATVAEQAFSVPESPAALLPGDCVVVSPLVPSATAVTSGHARINATGQLVLVFINPTAGALTRTATAYSVLIARQ